MAHLTRTLVSRPGRRWLLPLLALGACADESSMDPGGDASTEGAREGALEDLPGDLPWTPPASPSGDQTLVYARSRTLDAEGVLLAGGEWGGLTPEQELRVARPWPHLHEDVHYSEDIRDSVDEEGHVTFDYQVWSEVVDTPAELPAWEGPAFYTSAAAELMEVEWAADETHVFTVKLRDFPRWDVPLPPEPTVDSEEDVAVKEAARAEAIAEREALYDEMAAGIIAEVTEGGGEVLARGKKAGWVAVEVDHEGAAALGLRDDVATIALEEGGAESGAGGWAVGEAGVDGRMDTEDFEDNGYDGDADSGRSSLPKYDDIMIAVIDNGVRSAARAFCGDAGCTTANHRIAEMFVCSDPTPGGDLCETVTTFPVPPASPPLWKDWTHGTNVAAIALGDYTRGQANGLRLGDPSWTNDTCSTGSQCASGICESSKCAHSADWEEKASGIAPRAGLVFFGHVLADPSGSTPALGQAEAFDKSVDRRVDIISISQGNEGQRCHAVADTATEMAAELAYDDGIFIAACGGNFRENDPAPNCDPGGPCSTWSPGSLAKTFAVVGLDSTASGCNTNYHQDCPIHANSACPGDANAKVGAYILQGELSLVDVVASSGVSYTTVAGDPADATEEVNENASAFGCSMATPHVAGAAANIKDYFIWVGETWINSPGRLHAIMLSSADRASDVGTARHDTGSDGRWGFGRFKARFYGSGFGAISPWKGLISTVNMTQGGSNVVKVLSSTPLNASSPYYTFAKCISYQHEEFASDTTTPSISDIDLQVRIRSPVGGVCTPGSGTVHKTRTDHDLDWKRSVAIYASEVTGGFAGRCLEVTLLNDEVEATGETVTIRCYAADVDDDT